MAHTVWVLSAAKRLEAVGDAGGAERLYRQVLGGDPGNSSAARSLGALLLEQSRTAEAVPVIEAALRRTPVDARLLALYGRCMFNDGRIAQATQTLESALSLDRGNDPARIWLARCRTANHRAADAVGMLLPLAPKHGDDWAFRTALGQAYLALTVAADALVHLREAARLRPSAAAHSDLGRAYEMAGQSDKAIGEFDRAIALDPTLCAAVAGKISVLADMGRREEARRVLKDAVERGLADTRLAVLYARLFSSPEHRPAARRMVEATLANSNATALERAMGLRALGNLKEAEGDYDGEFECYRAANEPLRTDFDLAAYERACDDYIRVFSRETLSRLPRSSLRDPLPVFIVGMPRSGTSLVEQIVASHPRVHGAGELETLGRIVLDLPRALSAGGSGAPECVRSLTQESADQLSLRYLSLLHGLAGDAARATDKLPQNFGQLGLIDLLFPDARVIHCVRDPLDTCLSCYTTPLSQAHGYRRSLRDLAGVYRVYRRLMDHWRAVIRVPMLDVRYEDLVADTEHGARQLVEFLGLTWDDRCLRFYENERQVRTASVDQVRNPIYRSSVQRWKHYERHLEELRDRLAGLD